MKYVVRKKDGKFVDLGTERIWELFTDDFGLAYVELEESKEHYHKHTKEVYVVVDGKGKLKLGDKIIDLHPGVCVFIPPMMRHRVFDGKDLKIYVFTIPKWCEEDHILCS